MWPNNDNETIFKWEKNGLQKNAAKQCEQITLSSTLFDVNRFSGKSIKQSIVILGMWRKPIKVCFDPNTNGKQVQNSFSKLYNKLTFKSALIS